MSRDCLAVRLRAARERLVHELGAIAGDVTASALDRCPYRDRGDACTFAYGCRNQRRLSDGVRRCAGGVLNRTRA